MFKAILYYILYIAVFFITVLLGGFLFGIYMAIGTEKGYLDANASTAGEATSSPFAIICVLLGTLLVWLTFRHYHFSAFSLGNVIPSTKWKTMVLTTLPMLGFAMASNALLGLFHIDYLPKELLDMSYISTIFYGVVGAFTSAYVYYGAIQEELIKNGKRLWVQYLVLGLMMLPGSMMASNKTGDISFHFTLISLITACYGCWLYGTTRSSIVVFFCYLITSFVPDNLESATLNVAILAIGIIMLVYGTWALRKDLPLLLQTDESHQD